MGGSILDADYPQSGVNIPRRSTIDGQFAFLRDYITGENVRGQRPTEAGADE